MKVCVFTGTRAEYGLLRPVIQRLDKDDELTLDILVSGSHLSPHHGMTVREIENDGFTCLERAPINLNDDSRPGVCKSTGQAVETLGASLDKLRPDMLVLLGDRYEAMACALAASLIGIPVAHIHGGETTEGAVDEFFRHSITKMSHLHFTATETYRKRVIQLGEAPERVFNVGALGVENIRQVTLAPKVELAQQLNFSLDRPYLLVTFHPATLENNTAEDQCRAMLNALKATGLAVIFTKANADSHGRMINTLVDEFSAAEPSKYLSVTSLGLTRYLSAMANCTAVVGNSSSGIIEAPSMRVPTVNIGIRQQGRVSAESVIHCGTSYDEISAALKQCLNPEFRRMLTKLDNPYEKENTSAHIVAQIKRYSGGIIKSFYDLPTLF